MEGEDGQEYYSNDDPKWFGVHPKGDNPLPSRYRYLMEIIVLILIEIGLWWIYRHFTADWFAGFGTYTFYGVHIIAAPTIHIIPILLYWKFIRKERLFYKDDMENGEYMSFNFGPFKLTKKRLMTAVLVGLLGGIVWRISEMVVVNGASVVMGGTEFFTMMWLDVFTLSGMDFPTFFMMSHALKAGYRRWSAFRSRLLTCRRQYLML